MRRLALALVLLVASSTFGQPSGGGSSGTARRIIRNSSLPATCSVSDVYFKTAATVGPYFCLTTNNWTAATIGGYAPGGTDVAVTDGGTGLSTLTANNVILGNGTSAPLFVAPSTSGNILTSNGTTWTSAVPVAAGYTTTATAAGTTTLTSASTQQQFFTGSTTQTVVLPVTSTLVLGKRFEIVNNSTGIVTVNSSGGNAVVLLGAGTQVTVTCILTSGTTAASWSSSAITVNALPDSGVTPGTYVHANVAVDQKGRITSATSNSALKVLSANFVKNNDTLAPVTDLQVANLPIGIHNFRFFGLVEPDATGGFQFGFAGTLTATAGVSFPVVLVDNGTFASFIFSGEYGSPFIDTAGSVAYYVWVEGIIDVTVAGSFGVVFAQSSASGTSRIDAGANLAIW